MTSHPFVMLLVQVGAVAAALTAVTVFIERVWSPVKSWLKDALTNPLLSELEQIRIDMHDHMNYVQHHLGPNGSNTPIHVRVSLIEQQLRKMEGGKGTQEDSRWG